VAANSLEAAAEMDRTAERRGLRNRIDKPRALGLPFGRNCSPHSEGIVKHFIWVRWALVACVLLGLSVPWLYLTLLNNKDIVRSILSQIPTGPYLIDAYHHFVPTPREVNDIPYSIFSLKPAWEIENQAVRDALPDFSVIRGLNLDKFPSTSIPSSTRFNTWERSNADAFSSKYSELNQINVSNVKHLVPAWTYHSGEQLLNAKIWATNVETNPIIADRKIFVTTPADFLVSLNAVNGTEIWRTKLHRPARRGLLWWGGNAVCAPRLFVPTTNDGVYAVNPEDGRIIGEFGDHGHVGDAGSVVAPAVDGNILIVATLASTVEAYDVVSGKYLWKTPLLKKSDSFLPPPSQDFMLDGAVPWSGFSLDRVRSRIYVSTSEARPGLYGVSRPGKNDYTNSIVSIDIATGEIKWSFQEVAHDLWDFDLPAPPILTTIRRGDKLIDVVAAVTKIGNTLLLDRDSGKPIFDFRLRKAPVSRVPGEKTWPYQPAIELPEPFGEQVFLPSDVTNISEIQRASVERKLKNAEFGFFVPPAVQGTIVSFGLHGGAEWPGAAADQATGTLYVPSNRYPWIVRLYYRDRLSNPIRSTDPVGDKLYQEKCGGCHGVDREGYYANEFEGDKYYPSLVGISVAKDSKKIESFQENHSGIDGLKDVSIDELALISRYLSAADHISDDRRSLQLAGASQLLLDNQGYPGSQPPWGNITAIDLNSGKKIWRVPFGEYLELTKMGIPITGQPNFGGLIVTKGGLIFATGTIDKKIRALDSTSGTQLWDYDLPAPGSAPPSTYEIDGIQYLLVVATGGIYANFKDHSDAIIAFKLGN